MFYDGSLYQADVNDPTGTPGSSADYNLVTVMGPTGATGPTGPIGLTGPTGAQGPTGCLLYTSSWCALPTAALPTRRGGMWRR